MKWYTCLLFPGYLVSVAGCSGVQTFPNTVRAGETVAIAAGWKHEFPRSEISVEITPVGGTPIPVPPQSVRASINFYPDPLSSIVLSQETGTSISDFSQVYGDLVKTNVTGDDTDWWQTFVFVDLPASVPPGDADISVVNPLSGESVTTRVSVIGGAGVPDVFNAELAGPLNDAHLTSLERVDHYVVSFAGSVIPYAIQLDLDYANFTGYPVNPIGSSKNLQWADSGGKYRVLMFPANDQANQTLSDFKFYVAATAGDAATASLDVAPGSLQAFDQNGNLLSDTLTANVALVHGAAGLQ